jgi:hypothetical protein
MNEVEQKAYEWFIMQGYKPEEINFDPKRVFDFIVAGKPHVIKTLSHGTVYFSRDQIKEFAVSNPTILLFSKSSKSLITTIPFNKLKEVFKVKITQTRYVPKNRHNKCGGKLYSIYATRRIRKKLRLFSIGKICSKCYETIIDIEKVKSIFGHKNDEIEIKFLDEDI